MPPSPFDPKDAIRFDMNEGSVHSSAGTKMVVLSAQSVGALIAATGSQGGIGILRNLGDTVGAEALASLGRSTEGLAFTEVLEHIGGWLRLAGWGKLRAEVWGDAIVLEFTSKTVNARAAERLLEGLFTRVCGRSVSCVQGEGNRFILVNPEVEAGVRERLASGMRLGAVVGELELQP